MRASSVGALSAGPPIWHVTVTSPRGDGDAPTNVSALIEGDAEALGVDLRIDAHRCVARFYTRGESLRVATDTAFDRWDHIRVQLVLPEWRPSSIAVVRSDSATGDGQVPRSSGRHRAEVRAARSSHSTGPRFPYYLWSPG